VGWLGSGPRLIGQEYGLVPIFKKNAHLVGRLGSGPRLIGQEYGLVPIFKKMPTSWVG